MPHSGLETLTERIQEISRQGYIQTNREGDTGIGKTFEDCLGVAEDNYPYPDANGIELKTKREGSTANTTLFCLAPPIQRRWGKNLLRTAGYRDEKDRLALRTTLSTEPNNQGLAIEVSETHLTITHASAGVCAKYPLSIIKKRLRQKLQNLLFITAKTRTERGTELFWYHTATFYTELQPNQFLEELESGGICLEMRMTSEKNYGTAFRASSPEVFEEFYGTERDLSAEEGSVPPITIQPSSNQSQISDF